MKSPSINTTENIKHVFTDRLIELELIDRTHYDDMMSSAADDHESHVSADGETSSKIQHKHSAVLFAPISSPYPTWSLPVRFQWAGRPDVGILHCLSQLLLLFALFLGDILLLHLTVLQLVLQLHTARLQQAAEGRPALL